ncbi:MAG: GerMN domain-containing protein [Cyanobacteria bacterium J06623_7]
MQDRNNNRLSLTAIAAIVGVILAAGGGVAWWAKSNSDRTPEVVKPIPQPIPGKEASPPIPAPITQDKVVQICWLNPTGESIKLISKTMTFEKSIESKQILKTALETLLTEYPLDGDYTTAIPDGTKLLSLATDERGVHVNLSREFISGGGSASMSSRLAQIIYTSTSSGESDRVWISVEGEPLESLGEEGLIVSQPMTQKKFEDNFTL